MSASTIVLLILFATALVLHQTCGEKDKPANPEKKPENAHKLASQKVLVEEVEELQAQFQQLQSSLDNKRCELGPPKTFFDPHSKTTEQSGRTDKRRITFSKPFNSVPVVIASLNALDISKDANARLAVDVTNVDKTGFDLGVREWADTYTYGANVVWIACTF